jgi:hypothetical protein
MLCAYQEAVAVGFQSASNAKKALLTGSHPSWSTFLRYCNIWLYFVFFVVSKRTIS